MDTSERSLDDELVGRSPEVLREQALRRLKKRRDLKAHVFAYALINGLVWAIWLVVALTSHSWWPWPVFVTLGWGIGLAFNAWDVYFRRPITEDELRREMESLRHGP
jgi:2TM domain